MKVVFLDDANFKMRNYFGYEQIDNFYFLELVAIKGYPNWIVRITHPRVRCVICEVESSASSYALEKIECYSEKVNDWASLRLDGKNKDFIIIDESDNNKINNIIIKSLTHESAYSTSTKERIDILPAPVGTYYIYYA